MGLIAVKPNSSENTNDPTSYCYLKQVLTGVIMSDGSLVKKNYKSGGTYLKLAQSTINVGYITFVFNLFYTHGLCNMEAPSSHIAKVKEKNINIYNLQQNL
jgi:hypothetical protein